MKLKNKVAIITGGMGGIGKVIVESFLKEGAKVVVADINNSELKNIKGKNVIAIKTDISNIEQVKILIKKTISAYKTVDILVNVAGIQKPIGPLIDANEVEWIKNINTNLIGTMLCCKYVLPVMISKKKGKIINFSGGGATFPRINFSAYAAAKAAIVRFTETIAEEVIEFGIDINAISPGSIYTKMIEEIIQAGDKSNKNDLEGAIKIKREGGVSPELTAELAVFLASEESNGITGKLISSVWDDWRKFKNNITEIKKSSLFTLRRIDNAKFAEIKNRNS
jgi:NAD(P)-dependent dehydrogenase (short-subunit alcohol dehydrogenase family)